MTNEYYGFVFILLSIFSQVDLNEVFPVQLYDLREEDCY